MHACMTRWKKQMKHFIYMSLSLGFFTLLVFSLPNSGFAQCSQNDSSGGCAAVTTAIGSISTQPGGVVGSIMGVVLSLSGGVAIFLIIGAGYQMVMSQGNPEKVKEGRERLTSAIVGLLFIIFSVVILQIVGIDILHIPGLNP